MCLVLLDCQVPHLSMQEPTLTVVNAYSPIPSLAEYLRCAVHLLNTPPKAGGSHVLKGQASRCSRFRNREPL